MGIKLSENAGSWLAREVPKLLIFAGAPALTATALKINNWTIATAIIGGAYGSAVAYTGLTHNTWFQERSGKDFPGYSIRGPLKGLCIAVLENGALYLAARHLPLLKVTSLYLGAKIGYFGVTRPLWIGYVTIRKSN